jgi:putative transcription factor
MQCELCGRECDCRPAIVDGVKMMLCPSCMRHGTGVKTYTDSPTASQTPILERIKRPKIKDVYKDMDKELVSGWNKIVINARQKKGLSREELGFKIGERTVTIAKIENGDLRPSDKIIEKLEKELDIILFEPVRSVSASSPGSYSGKGLTLGDFIKKEED